MADEEDTTTENTETTNSWNDTTDTKSELEKFSISLKKEIPEVLMPKYSYIKNMADSLNRSEDDGIVNENGGNASIAVRDNKINVSASENTGTKSVGGSEQNIHTSFEEKFTTNRFKIDTDEIVINGHKLNPMLWEYTDFKDYTDPWKDIHKVGNFCLLGTVMTPTWDHQLKKYVLVRRLARMPMFSPLLNVPEISDAIDVVDPTKKVPEYPIKQQTVSAKQWYDMVKAAKKAKDDKDKADKDKADKDKNNSDNPKQTDPAKTEDNSSAAANDQQESASDEQTEENNNESSDNESTQRDPALSEAAAKEIEEEQKRKARVSAQEIVQKVSQMYLQSSVFNKPGVTAEQNTDTESVDDE